MTGQASYLMECTTLVFVGDGKEAAHKRNASSFEDDHKMYYIERSTLFQRIEYVLDHSHSTIGLFPKTGSDL